MAVWIFELQWRKSFFKKCKTITPRTARSADSSARWLAGRRWRDSSGLCARRWRRGRRREVCRRREGSVVTKRWGDQITRRTHCSTLWMNIISRNYWNNIKIRFWGILRQLLAGMRPISCLTSSCSSSTTCLITPRGRPRHPWKLFLRCRIITGMVRTIRRWVSYRMRYQIDLAAQSTSFTISSSSNRRLRKSSTQMKRLEVPMKCLSYRIKRTLLCKRGLLRCQKYRFKE